MSRVSIERECVPIELRRRITQWSRIWGLPDLAKSVTLLRSKRLRAALARCHPLKRTIVLRDDMPTDFGRLTEVLCHEFAHIAAYDLYGRYAKAHGTEWQKLVRAAGFRPRVRIEDCDPRKIAAKRTHSKARFEHRCPVCQMFRMARRPVANWRCSDCVIAGLGGELIIRIIRPVRSRARGR